MITILGASGFVGSNLVKKIDGMKLPFYAPQRNEEIGNKDLGDIIYCIGLTADFRSRPFDTIEAHVGKLKYVLESCRFNSLTYLSSTRIYIHNSGTVSEESPVTINVTDPFDLFNASKLAGELLALNCGKKNIRVARLSNIYGNDFKSENFVTSIVKDAIHKGKIVLRTTPDSAKDYINIDDVCDLLLKMAIEGKQPVYNLASGINISNKDILDIIQQETKCTIEYSPAAEKIIFPPIQVDKIKSEFGYTASRTLLHDLKRIVQNFKNELSKEN